jgi:hypothetical protein
MRRFGNAGIAAIAAVGMLCAIAFINWWLCDRALSQVIAANPRNEGVVAHAHFDHYVAPRTLVFDVRDLSPGKTKLDVFRVLLEFAESQTGNDFESVKLDFRGEAKFVLKGAFFKALGENHRDQNPIYTLRTFPQNAYTPEGRQAFPTWKGASLEAFGHQLEDFNELHQQWYLKELAHKHE